MQLSPALLYACLAFQFGRAYLHRFRSNNLPIVFFPSQLRAFQEMKSFSSFFHNLGIHAVRTNLPFLLEQFGILKRDTIGLYSSPTNSFFKESA